nr:hypothetical protein [Ophiocordyceps lanpingensis]
MFLIKYLIYVYMGINLLDIVNNPIWCFCYTYFAAVFRLLSKFYIEVLIQERVGLGGWFRNTDTLGGGSCNPQSYAQKGSTMNAQSSNPQQGSSSTNPEPSIPQLSNTPQQGNPQSSLPQSSNQPQGPVPLIVPPVAGSSNTPPLEQTMDIDFLFPHQHQLRHNIIVKINNRLAMPSHRLWGVNIGHSHEHVEGFRHFNTEEKEFMVTLSTLSSPQIHTTSRHLRGIRLAIVTEESKMSQDLHGIRLNRPDKLRIYDLVRLKKLHNGSMHWVTVTNSKDDLKLIRKFIRDTQS